MDSRSFFTVGFVYAIIRAVKHFPRTISATALSLRALFYDLPLYAHFPKSSKSGIILHMIDIVQEPSAVLRKTAKEVPVKDIKSAKIQKILKDMSDTLALEKNGAALAAPQIGKSLRIFIVSGKVLRKTDNPDEHTPPDQIYINPVLKKLSRKKESVDEGCLSVRNHYGVITRATNATIEAYDMHGEKFTRGAGGLLAQIFQHEVDHLQGVLFIDNAKEIWEADETEEDEDNIGKKIRQE
jgi:peptide deformylase